MVVWDAHERMERIEDNHLGDEPIILVTIFGQCDLFNESIQRCSRYGQSYMHWSFMPYTSALE